MLLMQRVMRNGALFLWDLLPPQGPGSSPTLQLCHGACYADVSHWFEYSFIALTACLPLLQGHAAVLARLPRLGVQGSRHCVHFV